MKGHFHIYSHSFFFVLFLYFLFLFVCPLLIYIIFISIPWFFLMSYENALTLERQKRCWLAVKVWFLMSVIYSLKNVIKMAEVSLYQVLSIYICMRVLVDFLLSVCCAYACVWYQIRVLALHWIVCNGFAPCAYCCFLKMLFFSVEDVPMKDYMLPLSKAEVIQEGMLNPLFLFVPKWNDYEKILFKSRSGFQLIELTNITEVFRTPYFGWVALD